VAIISTINRIISRVTVTTIGLGVYSAHDGCSIAALIIRSCFRLDRVARTQLGQRSFHVATPTVWNSLPTFLRSASIRRGQFRDGLKTHFFTHAYA